jgi:hypothetical protein
MKKDKISELICREYWTIDEFSYLLSGRGCDVSKPRNDHIKRARNEITSAIGAGKLEILPDQDSAAIMYGLTSIQPVQAVKWVKSKPAIWAYKKTFPDILMSDFPNTNELLQIDNVEDKRLNTMERNSLLIIIAALCDQSDIKLDKGGAATQIAKFTEDIGAPVSDDTVRRFLKLIPQAIQNRTS